MNEHEYSPQILLLYHIVIPAQYRQEVFIPEVAASLIDICGEIGQKHEIRFFEIGLDEAHVHMLVQGLPTMPVTRIITLIQRLTERELFTRHPTIKKDILWGGPLWSRGSYAHSVGLPASNDTIQRYIQEQGLPDAYEKGYEGSIELEV